jgi:hypothetical protein
MIALLLHCAPILAAQSSPPRLLDVPPGWRHERLQLPPDFAPELAYRGIEDLAFAPGMFEPGSDSYFSYALALRLEGDVHVDEPMLTRFLDAYYRGLYHAAAEGRGFANDESTIRSTVQQDGARFHATVHTFDSFTNGAALALALEISTHSAPRATEILGLASPLPSDAPIWKDLRALEAAWRAARPAPVFLNHVFFVVDRETYDALARSSFLRESFALTEERTTRRADVSYTGLYVYGRRTYFEFLPPESAAGLVPGDTGVALGVETSGALELLARALEQRGVKNQGGPITRELDGAPVPWFQILGVEVPSGPFSLFAMEYDPRFLAGWHADLPPRLPSLARAAVLERYAASLGRTELHARAPFADVSGVHLALDDAQRERLLAVCAAAGYEVEASAESTTCFGPQFRIVIERSSEPRGVTALELALRQALAHEPLQLGRASLSFHGVSAQLGLAR